MPSSITGPEAPHLPDTSSLPVPQNPDTASLGGDGGDAADGGTMPSWQARSQPAAAQVKEPTGETTPHSEGQQRRRPRALVDSDIAEPYPPRLPVTLSLPVPQAGDTASLGGDAVDGGTMPSWQARPEPAAARATTPCAEGRTTPRSTTPPRSATPTTPNSRRKIGVSLKYRHLPPTARKAIEALDINRSGSVDIVELEEAGRATVTLHRKAKTYRRVALASILICIIFGLMIFFLSYASMELAKDIHLGENAVLITSDGEVVQTSNNEMTVDKNTGELVIRIAPVEARRLQEECKANGDSNCELGEGSIIKTSAAKRLALFNISLTQDQLSTLLGIQVKGQTQIGLETSTYLEVLSTIRQVAPGSSCGYVLIVRLSEGSLLLDGQDIYADSPFAQVLVSEGMLPESTKTSSPLIVSKLASIQLTGTFTSEFSEYKPEFPACGLMPEVPQPTGPHYFYSANLKYTMPDSSTSEVAQHFIKTGSQVVVVTTAFQTRVERWDLAMNRLTTMVLVGNKRLYCHDTRWGDEVSSALENTTTFFPDSTSSNEAWSFVGNTMFEFPKLISVFRLQGSGGMVDLHTDIHLRPSFARVLPSNPTELAVDKSIFAEVTFLRESVRFNATLEEAQAALLGLNLDLFPGCGLQQDNSAGDIGTAEVQQDESFAGLVPETSMDWLPRQSPPQSPSPLRTPINFSDPSLIQGCTSTCYHASLGLGNEVPLLRSCFGPADDDGICDKSKLQFSATLVDDLLPEPSAGFYWGKVQVIVTSTEASVQVSTEPLESFSGDRTMVRMVQDWLVKVPQLNLEMLNSVVRLPAHDIRFEAMVVGNPPRLQGEGTSVVTAQLVPNAPAELTVIAINHIGLNAPLCIAEAVAHSLPAHCRLDTVDLKMETHVLAPASYLGPFLQQFTQILASGDWRLAVEERPVPDNLLLDSSRRLLEEEETEQVAEESLKFSRGEEAFAGPHSFREETRRLSEDDPDPVPDVISQTPEFLAAQRAVQAIEAAYESAAEDPNGCWDTTATQHCASCPTTDLDFFACENVQDAILCAKFEYCPYVTGVLTEAEDWTTRATLHSTLTAAAAPGFARILREVAGLLVGWMDAKPDITTWAELESPSELKSILQTATARTLPSVNLGVAVKMVQLAQRLIMKKEASARVPKTFKWFSLAKSALLAAGTEGPAIAADLMDELMMITMGSGDNDAEVPAIYLLTAERTTYEDASFEVDVSTEPHEVTLMVRRPVATLQFPGTKFKLRVQAERLSITQTLQQGSKPSETLQDEVRKLIFDDSEVIVIPMSVGSEEEGDGPQGGDEWKVPLEGDPVSLLSVLPTNHGLPSWLPLSDLNVHAFTWNMHNKSLSLTWYGQLEPSTASAVELMVMKGKMVFEESKDPRFQVDWINVTMKFNGVTTLIYNAIDDDSLAALPSLAMTVSGSEHIDFVLAVANRTLDLLGVEKQMGRHAHIAQANLQLDVSTMTVTEASISDAMFYLYAGLYSLDVSQDSTQRADDVHEAKAPVLSFFLLHLNVVDGEIVSLGQAEGAEFLDLYIPGLNFALQEETFEGAGPDTVFLGGLIQDPTAEAMTTLSSHLNRILCYDNMQASWKIGNATMELKAGTFEVTLTLHDVTWAIDPEGVFPMLGNVSVLVETLQLSLGSSIILDNLPTVSDFGGDKRMRFLTAEASGVSLGFPRLSMLDNVSLWHMPLQPNRFSGCGWKELDFTGNMLAIFEGSASLQGRLARVVFSHKQALQLTPMQRPTSNFLDGASATLTIRLFVEQLAVDDDGAEIGLRRTMRFTCHVDGPAHFRSGGARRLKDWGALRRLQELTEQDGIPRRLSATVPPDQEATDSFSANEGVTIDGRLEYPNGVLVDWLSKLVVTGEGIESPEYRLLREAADPQNHDVARRLAELEENLTCSLPKPKGIELEPEWRYSCEAPLLMPWLQAEERGRELFGAKCDITAVIDLSADGFDPFASFGQPFLKYALLSFGIPDSDANKITKGLTKDAIQECIPIVSEMMGGDFTVANVRRLMATLGIDEEELDKYMRMFGEGTLYWAGLPRGAARTIIRNGTLANTSTGVGWMSLVMMNPSSASVPHYMALMSFNAVNKFREVYAAPLLARAMQSLGTPSSSAQYLAYSEAVREVCLKPKTDLGKVKDFLGEIRVFSELHDSNFSLVCSLAELMCVGPDLGPKFFDPMVRGRLATLNVLGETIAEVTPGIVAKLVEACGDNPSQEALQLSDDIYALLSKNFTEADERDSTLASVLDSQNAALSTTTHYRRLLSMFRTWGIPPHGLVDIKDKDLKSAPTTYQEVGLVASLWEDEQGDVNEDVVSPLLRSLCDALGVDPIITYGLEKDFSVKFRNPWIYWDFEHAIIRTDVSQIMGTLAGELTVDICEVMLHLFVILQADAEFLGPIMGSALKNTFKAFRVPIQFTDDLASYYSIVENAKNFMNTPSCSAIFTGRASYSDLEFTLNQTQLTPFTTADLQLMIKYALLDVGALPNQADALSEKATDDSMALIGPSLFPLLTRIGDPEVVGMAIYDIVMRLDPRDHVNTPVRVIQEILVKQLDAYGFPSTVGDLITAVTTVVKADDTLRLICAEFVGPFVTGDVDLVVMYSVIEKLAPSLLLNQFNAMASVILGKAFRNIGVDLTNAQVVTVLEDPDTRPLLQQLSWKLLRGRVDANLVLKIMDSLSLNPIDKFLQPHYEAGIQKICLSSTLAQEAGFTVQSTDEAELIGLLHDGNIDVRTMLNHISRVLGETAEQVNVKLVKPCLANILVQAGLLAGAQDLMDKMLKKVTAIGHMQNTFLNGVIARRVDSGVIYAANKKEKTQLGALDPQAMHQLTHTETGVLLVMRRSRERWAELVFEPPAPGKARPLVRDPMTICAKVLPPALSFFKRVAPSPMTAVLRFNQDFSDWELITDTLSFTLGGPVPALLSVGLYANNAGISIMGGGSITDKSLSGLVSGDLDWLLTGITAQFKAELNVPFSRNDAAGRRLAEGKRRLAEEGTTIKAYAMLSLSPEALPLGDIFKIRGAGQILVGLDGPLASPSFTLYGAQGCLDLSAPSIGIPLITAIFSGVKDNPEDNMTLEVRAEGNFSVDFPESTGLGQLNILSRLKIDIKEKTFEVLGRMDSLVWKVPNTDLAIDVQARIHITKKTSNATKPEPIDYSVQIIGCMPALELPFRIIDNLPPPKVSLKAFFYLSRAAGKTTTKWEVRGRMTGELWDFLQDPVLELSINSTTGLTITGAARVNIPFPGDIGVVKAAVQLEFTQEKGLRGAATVAIPITPQEWGIKPAIARIMCDRETGLFVNATIEDIMDLRSLLPSQNIVNTVALRASIQYPNPTLYVTAFASFTLPTWLGSRDVDVFIHLTSAGLTVYGRIDLGFTLIPMRDTFGEDLRLNQLELIAVASWKQRQDLGGDNSGSSGPSGSQQKSTSTSPSASLVVEAELGTVFHGIVGFDDGVCAAFVMTETPPWLVNFLASVDTQITNGRGISLSICQDTTLFQDYSFVLEQLVMQTNMVLPAQATNSLLKVKSVFDTLPDLIMQGVHFTFPCSVIEGTATHNFIEKTNVGGRRSEFQAFFNFQWQAPMTFRAGLMLPPFPLPKTGPIIEAFFQVNVEFNWQVGASPQVAARGMLALTMKIGKTARLKMVGSIAVGSMVEAILRLEEPTVLPLISPRLALIRTTDFPTEATVRLTATGDFWLSFSGGVILDTNHRFALRSGTDAGQDELTGCYNRSTCHAYQIHMVLDILFAPVPVPRDFFIRLRMKPAALTLPEFIMAVVGLPLPSGALALARSVVAPTPVLMALEARVGINGFELKLAAATTWNTFASDMMLTTEFALRPGEMPNIALSFAANAFCLGLTRPGDQCFGLRLNTTTTGGDIYKKSREALMMIWDTDWENSYLPPRLRNGDNVGPAVDCRLRPAPRLQMAVTARWEAGNDTLSFLGSVDLTATFSNSEIFISSTTSVAGIQYAFTLDLTLGNTPADFALNRFELIMDFSGLFDAIKEAAKSVLGSFLYNVAKNMGVFDRFRIQHGLFSIDSTDIRLALELRIYWEVKLDVRFGYVEAAELMAGQYLEIARSTLRAIKEKVADVWPCTCVTDWYSRSQESYGWVQGTHTVPTWGLCTTKKCTSVTSKWCGWDRRRRRGRRRWSCCGNFRCDTRRRYQTCINVPCGGVSHVRYPKIGQKLFYRRRKCETAKWWCPLNPFNVKKGRMETWRYENPLDLLAFLHLPPPSLTGISHECNRR